MKPSEIEREITKEKERLAAIFNEAVEKEADKVAMELLQFTIGPRLQREINMAEKVMNNHPGFMTKKEFNQIRACLHTDRIAGDAERTDAFILLTSFEKYLVKKEERPVQKFGKPLPSTMAEWEEMKRRGDEIRKQQRAARAQQRNKSDRAQ